MGIDLQRAPQPVQRAALLVEAGGGVPTRSRGSARRARRSPQTRKSAAPRAHPLAEHAPPICSSIHGQPAESEDQNLLEGGSAHHGGSPPPPPTPLSRTRVTARRLVVLASASALSKIRRARRFLRARKSVAIPTCVTRIGVERGASQEKFDGLVVTASCTVVAVRRSRRAEKYRSPIGGASGGQCTKVGNSNA